jgi:HD-GYP domain-containing protein (c-di-GMP phosphodiesterase class II)
MTSDSGSSHDLQVISLESLEAVERIAKGIGWKPEVIEAAKHAVNLAVKAVTKEPDLMKLLKQKMKNPESKYSHHVSLLSLLACGVCQSLGWTSESTQMKLGLAALLHDITVEESYYSDIHLWNQAASDKEKSHEVTKYRNHPADAANLILEMKTVPADVDQIILQHHETKEGTGFPRGLISSRISPMACIFIITEDLINFVEDAVNMDEKIQMFLTIRDQRYNSGNFKKVFDAFKDSVEKQKRN